jgi:hypothetical protein
MVFVELKCLKKSATVNSVISNVLSIANSDQLHT